MNILDINFNRQVLNEVGSLLNVIVVSIAALAPILPLTSIYARLDPFYYVFEALILPHPYYRSMSTILLTPIIRYFLSLICVVEFTRFALLGILFLTLSQLFTLYLLRKIARIESTTREKAHRMYIKLRLVFVALFHKLSFVASCLMFYIHAATVIGFWLLIQCWGLIPLFLSFVMVIVTFCAVFITLLFLPASAIIHEESEALIGAKRNRYYCTNYKRKWHYLEYIRWKAQHNIGIQCGSLFVIKHSTTENYFFRLVDSLANALLLG